MPSDEWTKDFKICQAGQERSILNKMTGNAPMSDMQLKKFVQLMRMHKYGMGYTADDPRFGLSYDAMTQASKLLCRWPRPDELGRWAESEGILVGCFRARVDLGDYRGEKKRQVGMNNLLGPLGRNFKMLTDAFKLMYVMMDGRNIMVYGANQGVVNAAVDHMARFASSHGFDATTSPAEQIRLNTEVGQFKAEFSVAASRSKSVKMTSVAKSASVAKPAFALNPKAKSFRMKEKSVAASKGASGAKPASKGKSTAASASTRSASAVASAGVTSARSASKGLSSSATSATAVGSKATSAAAKSAAVSSASKSSASRSSK